MTGQGNGGASGRPRRPGVVENAPASPRISVLFVDDEPAILRGIARALQGAPIDLAFANSPSDALDLLEERRVDVLVADVDMPEMCGTELVRVVRRDHPATIRMLLTGNATLEKAVEAINQGEILRYFPKPFVPQAFLESISALADRIEKQRREGTDEHRQSRRAELLRWAEGRFPGLTELARDEADHLVVDLPRLYSSVERSGSTAACELLRREG